MPYHVAKSEQCPTASPYAVIKTSDGKMMGCHPSKAAADRQVAALYANERGARVMTYDRAVAHVSEYEFRGSPADGGMPRFYGYAAVFSTDSEPLPFIESIDPGAFARSLKSDRNHSFVVDHDDNRVLSSRATKRLALAEDSKGLMVESDLPNTSYARDLVALHEDGEVRGMSFTFKPTKTGESWSSDMKRRRLTEVRLGHVTAITSGFIPAYRTTTASIRSLSTTLGTEAEDLEDVIDSIRDGKRLDARAVDLLQSVIAALREQSATEIVTGDPAATLSIRRLQLELAAKAR